MISREPLSLAKLLKAQTLYIHEEIGVIKIDKDKNFMLVNFQVVVLDLKGFNNDQQLIHINFISSFKLKNTLPASELKRLGCFKPLIFDNFDIF